MDAVKSFNQELSALYEVKPPISKAKMTALTRGAIKAIKFYKHVVQSVEKFILKCKPDYKVPGLYVIDSIVRQSRHQFGPDKDVFAPRFSKNMQQTFLNLFKCPPEDKSKIIRVLNLWQKNHVFPPEVIQPLFDLADPNNPIHKELATTPQNGLNMSSTSIAKGSPAMQRTPTKGNQPGNETVHGSANLNIADPNVLQQLQQLQRLLTKSAENAARADSQVHFDKKLLDFDYGDDEDEVNNSPRPANNNSNDVSNLLTNPEILRHLQTLQTMVSGQTEMDVDKLRKMQEMKQQEDEFDKHLAQTVPNLPFAAECEFKSNNNQNSGATFYNDGMSAPPSHYETAGFDTSHQQTNKSSGHDNDVEVITLDHDDSRSGSPVEDRYSRRRRSRSRSRDRRSARDKDRKRRSRSRSNRRYRSRSRERVRTKEKDKEKEKETEKDRERKKRGLPVIKKDHLSICSTTLWVGHLSKLVHQDDLSNTFGEFGDVVSIDLIPPRGCAFIVMLRRQDAARCLGKLKGHMLHGKAITLAWAPGKGVKGKELKDYWEGDLGVSYIPYHKLRQDMDLELIEDGGMIDEDTMPEWMKEKVDRMAKKPVVAATANVEVPSNFMIGEIPNTHRPAGIDTSQPPPLPSGLLQPPPMMPLVNPFQFNNRLLGMNMMGNMANMSNLSNMPNIPIGVPPPNISGALMQNQLLGLGSPFQGPPGLMPPQIPNIDKPNPPPVTSDSTLHSLSESLMSLAQQNFTGAVIAPPPQPQQEDPMDVEMEDAERTDRFVSFKIGDRLGTKNDERRDNRREDRDRRDDRDGRRDDRDRRNRSRDRESNRDRDRDRVKERHNSRDRDRDKIRDRDVSRGRDRDGRGDGRRDRAAGANRWGDKDRERRDNRDDQDKREREKNLNDRLREMAGMAVYDDRDRNMGRSRDRRDNVPRPLFQHPMQNDDFPRAGTRGRGISREFGDTMNTPPMGDMKHHDNSDRDPSKLIPSGHEDNSEKTSGNDTGDAGENRCNELGGQPLVMEGPPDLLEGPGDAMDGPPDLRLPHRPSHIIDGPPEQNMDDNDLLIDGPPGMMMDGPPHRMMRDHMHRMLDGPPHRLMDGPPHRMMDGPPHRMLDGPRIMMDGPSDMMDGPPDMMMDGPPHMMMDGPPNMMMDGHPRFRFPRGGMRGPPPRWDFFGPRGGGPPMMRGPNFGPRGPRGAPGRFFSPRGPRGPFREFNRFEGPPEFFRGPGGPSSGPRLRPPLFERSGRADRRSRWGGDSPSREEDTLPNEDGPPGHDSYCANETATPGHQDASLEHDEASYNNETTYGIEGEPSRNDEALSGNSEARTEHKDVPTEHEEVSYGNEMSCENEETSYEPETRHENEMPFQNEEITTNNVVETNPPVIEQSAPGTSVKRDGNEE